MPNQSQLILNGLFFVNIKATPGWLEPLLQRIKDDRKAVLVPIINVIDDRTLGFFPSSSLYPSIGSFTWSGHFSWTGLPQREMKRRSSPVAPARSPTMAGGLFAADRKYFWEIGQFSL